MNYLSQVPRSTEDMLRKIRIIEDNLKEQLENLKDLRLSLLNPVGIEEKMPAGIVNVDLVHRVIDTNIVGKEVVKYMGRNMNEEY